MIRVRWVESRLQGGGRGSPTRKGGVSEETGTVLAVGSRVQKERAVRVCGQR